MRSISWIGPFLLCSVMLAQAPAPQAPPATQPKPAPRPAKVPRTLENMFSVSVFYWKPDQGKLGFYPGKLFFNTVSTRFNLPESRRANGIQITIPTGASHRLEVGFWTNRGSGSTRATQQLNLYGANVKRNELIDSNYNMSNFRLAWNYLTFPVPALDAKLRVKTFWEVQHTRIKPVLAFPESVTSPGATVGPKQSITFPGFGIGMEYVPASVFRFEARISGMALPGKARYADAEISAVGSIRSIELFGGLKGFHFRTGPGSETYQQAYIWGPMFGARWVFR